MKVSIQQGIEMYHSGLYLVHFRPEKNLPEDEQYCLVRLLTEIYDVEEA
jgi:hypothetical protein